MNRLAFFRSLLVAPFAAKAVLSAPPLIKAASTTPGLFVVPVKLPYWPPYYSEADIKFAEEMAKLMQPLWDIPETTVMRLEDVT